MDSIKYLYNIFIFRLIFEVTIWMKFIQYSQNFLPYQSSWIVLLSSISLINSIHIIYFLWIHLKFKLKGLQITFVSSHIISHPLCYNISHLLYYIISHWWYHITSHLPYKLASMILYYVTFMVPPPIKPYQAMMPTPHQAIRIQYHTTDWRTLNTLFWAICRPPWQGWINLGEKCMIFYFSHMIRFANFEFIFAFRDPKLT